MPTAYLIAKAAREAPSTLAPWDRDIPRLPRLPPGVEDRRLLKIENIVTTSSSNSKKLKRLTRKCTSASDGPKKGSKFSSVRYKSRRPRATTLCFSSGNQVVAGTKSQSQALLAHHSFSRIVSRILGQRATLAQNFTIQNMVASAFFGYFVNIDKLSSKNADIFSYDPKLFPGARGKFEGLSTSVLLFSSGNGVITGAKNEMEIVHTFNLVYDVVNGYFGEKTEAHADKGDRFSALEHVQV